VIAVEPIGTAVPDATVHAAVTGWVPPVTTGAEYDATAVEVGVVNARLAGHVIDGASTGVGVGVGVGVVDGLPHDVVMTSAVISPQRRIMLAGSR